MELAVAGNANYIVTKNLKDFRRRNVFDSFKVITPKQLLENPDVRYHIESLMINIEQHQKPCGISRGRTLTRLIGEV